MDCLGLPRTAHGWPGALSALGAVGATRLPLACVGGVKREQGSARPVDGTDLCGAPQCQRALRATARPGAARGVRRRKRRLGAQMRCSREKSGAWHQVKAWFVLKFAALIKLCAFGLLHQRVVLLALDRWSVGDGCHLGLRLLERRCSLRAPFWAVIRYRRSCLL